MRTNGKPEIQASPTTGALVAAPRNAATLKAFLESKEAQSKIAAVLPRTMSPERLVRVLLASVQAAPKLAECTQASVLLGIMHCAALGLEPNSPLGHAYLIPFGTVATPVIGYKGLVKLAMQSEQVAFVEARVVHARDEFVVEFGLSPKLVHKPWLGGGAPGAVSAAYAIVRLKGEQMPMVGIMTTEEIETIRGRSRAGKAGPWVTDWEQMACKTVLRRVLKYAPMSDASALAVAEDERREYGDVIETTATEMTAAAPEPQAADVPPTPTETTVIDVTPTPPEVE